ncbi:MAG: 16S rRNA (cytosine(967)-C(5))-methyltransferase RsmB [Lachnospiraceae bacterium]|nr:16S rRNA (cytosine(967)-C(5))-methyltransferase RsmB [Lachnospiraceae bacterium]
MNVCINERDLALKALLSIVEKKEFSHTVLNQILGSYQDLDKRSRAFVTHLTMGSLEHLLELDYIINQFSKVLTDKMKPLIRNLLRISVYQLKYMENIPHAAVCNEAVKITKKHKFNALSGFVNGVLRNISRNLEQVQYPKEKVSYLSVKYSIPIWILQLWLKEYDEKTVTQMIKSFGQKRDITIRTNLSRISAESLKSKLQAEGLEVKQHPYLPYAFSLNNIDYLEGLQSFQAGDFYVQDASSMLVGELAQPKPGAFIVDLCAAPGGKSFHLADRLNGTGQIEARDISDKKLRLIQENKERGFFENIKVLKADARVPDAQLLGRVDVVIADVPCSGLGLLGKKPDLRYNISEKGISDLILLQREILMNGLSYVKPAGTLLFSTCTVNRAENIENVHWMLENFPAFSLAEIKEDLPACLSDSLVDGCLQLLPGIHKCDGFFIAKLVRV